MDTISLQTNNSVEVVFNEELKEVRIKRRNRFLFFLSVFIGSTALLLLYVLTPLLGFIQ